MASIDISLPQPVPPSWKDLGKSSSDLLGKDYHFNAASLEVKTNTPSGVAFRVAGSTDPKSDDIKGDLEAKFTDRKHGLVFTQAWTTANALKNTIELENQIAKGLKVDINTTLNPDTSAKSVLLNTAYKQSGFHTRTGLNVFNGPVVTADAVVGRDGFLFGAETAYNLTSGAITRYATAVGYNAPDYSVTLHALNNLNTYTASYYHRVNREVEAGAKAVYDSHLTKNGVALEVGTKVYLDDSAVIKAKINDSGVVALAYGQSLRPGVKAYVGLAVDTTKLNATAPSGPVHKAGIHFLFEG